jgi:hypothetical protein
MIFLKLSIKTGDAAYDCHLCIFNGLLGFNGFHPVSGNRQFGIKLLSNGKYEIFTKGVDRLWFQNPGGPTINATGKLIAYLMEPVAFTAADLLWESFQDKTTRYVNINGGNATGHVTEKKRPKVSSALKHLLKSINVINKVPCDH